MSIYKKFTTLLLGLALTAPLGWANPTASPPPAANQVTAPVTLSEVISAVEQTYGTATSIRAEFVQVDRSKAMGTEVRQRGKIALERPRKMRVDMGFPVTHTYVSDGKTMSIYVAKDKQVTMMPELDGGAGMGVLLEDLGKLSELFNVTLLPEKPGKPSITVQLVPKQPGAFKSLLLTLSKQKYVLQDLVLVNQLDDVTEMNFTAVRMNQDIPDAEFTFVAPPGVKVVKTGAM
ncbi:MAG: outer membrane lipoprotein carrier protein LolA [Pseudomonadota bacterium]|nr:outer membrane lipoprotein carrier protein LolA [Pseudomonadota bacterium]